MSMNGDNITVEFSGWARISAAKVKLQYCGPENTKDLIITGDVWKKLPPDERTDYILESVVDLIKDSEDGDWSLIDLDPTFED